MLDMCKCRASETATFFVYYPYPVFVGSLFSLQYAQVGSGSIGLQAKGVNDFICCDPVLVNIKLDETTGS